MVSDNDSAPRKPTLTKRVNDLEAQINRLIEQEKRLATLEEQAGIDPRSVSGDMLVTLGQLLMRHGEGIRQGTAPPKKEADSVPPQTTAKERQVLLVPVTDRRLDHRWVLDNPDRLVHVTEVHVNDDNTVDGWYRCPGEATARPLTSGGIDRYQVVDAADPKAPPRAGTTYIRTNILNDTPLSASQWWGKLMADLPSYQVVLTGGGDKIQHQHKDAIYFSVVDTQAHTLQPISSPMQYPLFASTALDHIQAVIQDPPMMIYQLTGIPPEYILPFVRYAMNDDSSRRILKVSRLLALRDNHS